MRVECPHCKAVVHFKRDATGRWVGTLAGGSVGWALASTLGIAGTVLGAPIAIPAALVGLGIGAALGNRAGAAWDNAGGDCPKCKNWIPISE